MSDDVLKITRRGRTLCLQMAATARKNALSRPLLAGLTRAVQAAGEDTAGIVITGGLDIFSAGADFREITGTSADVAYDDAVGELTGAIRASGKLVIAAIEGPCIGAAVDVALNCDLRVAAQDSYLLLPAIRLGLLYNPEAINRLRQTYPRDTIRRLLLLGERFVAEDALTGGLVSRVVARGEALATAAALLEEVTEAQLPALAATKQLLAAQDGDAYRADDWHTKRVQLLDSEARRDAVERARRHFVKK